MSDPIRSERQAGAVTLTIARPPLNILDLAAIETLDAALAGLEGDRELQVLCLRGEGERAFSAGVAVQEVGPGEWLLTLSRAVSRLMPKPKISSRMMGSTKAMMLLLGSRRICRVSFRESASSRR